jgi:hypothetical protein
MWLRDVLLGGIKLRQTFPGALRGSGREAAIRRKRTCQKWSSPRGDGPDRLFVPGRDIGVASREPRGQLILMPEKDSVDSTKGFGVVPAISRKGENRHFPATITLENTAWEPLQPRNCQRQDSKRKSLSAGHGWCA